VRQPEYGSQILRFQMMYMIPSRRAIAKSLPNLSSFSNHVMTDSAFLRWDATPALTIQSHARPS
jgi:hypothetical protein